MLHPISYRLSINKFWLSTWNSYSLKNYRNLILNDKILKVLGIIFTNCFKINYPVPSSWSNTRKLFRRPFMKAMKKAKNIGFDGRVSIQIGPYKLKKVADFILPENYKIIRFSNFSILKICFLIDDNWNPNISRHKKLRSPLTYLDMYYARKSKKKNSPVFRRKLGKFLSEKKNFKSTGYFIYITNLLKNKHVRHEHYSELIYEDRNNMKIDRKKKKSINKIEENIRNIFRELIVKYINNTNALSDTTIDSVIDKWLNQTSQNKSIKFKNYIKRYIKTNDKNKLLEINFIEGTELRTEIDKLFIGYLKDRMSKRLRMDFVGMRFEESKEMVRELDYIEEEESEEKQNLDDKKHWGKNIIVTLLNKDEKKERRLMLKKIRFKKNLADLERYFGNNIKEDRIKARIRKKKKYISKFNSKQNDNRLMIFNFYYNNFTLLNKIRNNYFLFYFKDLTNNDITKNVYLKKNITKSSVNFSTFSQLFSSNKTYSKFNNKQLTSVNEISTNKKNIKLKFLSNKSRIKQKDFYSNSSFTRFKINKSSYNSKKSINHFNLINQNFNRIKTFNNYNKSSFYNNINFLFTNFIKPSFSINSNNKLYNSKHNYDTNFLKSILFLNSYNNLNKQFKYNFKEKIVKKIGRNINLFGIKSYLTYLNNRYNKKKYKLSNKLLKKSSKKFNFKILNINSNLKLWFLKKVKKQKNINSFLYKKRISKWYDFNINVRRFLHFSNIILLKTLTHSLLNNNNKTSKNHKRKIKHYYKLLNNKKSKKKVYYKLSRAKNTLFKNSYFKWSKNKKLLNVRWYHTSKFLYHKSWQNKTIAFTAINHKVNLYNKSIKGLRINKKKRLLLSNKKKLFKRPSKTIKYKLFNKNFNFKWNSLNAYPLTKKNNFIFTNIFLKKKYYFTWKNKHHYKKIENKKFSLFQNRKLKSNKYKFKNKRFNYKGKGYNNRNKKSNNYFNLKNKKQYTNTNKWKRSNYKHKRFRLNNKKKNLFNNKINNAYYKNSISTQKINLFKLVKNTFTFNNNYSNFLVSYIKNKNKFISKNNFFVLRNTYISTNSKKKYNLNIYNKFKLKKGKFFINKLIFSQKYNIKKSKKNEKYFNDISTIKVFKKAIYNVNNFSLNKLSSVKFKKLDRKTYSKMIFRKKLKDRFKFRKQKNITYWVFKTFSKEKQDYWRNTYYINFCKKKPTKFIPYNKFNKYNWLKKKELKQRYYLIFNKHQHNLNTSLNFKIWWPNNFIKDALYNRNKKLKLKYLFWSKHQYNKQLLNNKIRNFLINNFLNNNKNYKWQKKSYLRMFNKKFNRLLKVKNNFLINPITNYNKYSIFLYNSFKNSFSKKLFYKSNLYSNSINNYYKKNKKYINSKYNNFFFNKKSFNFTYKSLILLLNNSTLYSNYKNNLLIKFKYKKLFRAKMKKNINNLFNLFILAKKNLKKTNFFTNPNNLNKNSLYLLNNFNLTNRLLINDSQLVNDKLKNIKNIFEINGKTKLIKKINFKNIGLLNYNALRSKLYTHNKLRLYNIVDNSKSSFNSSFYTNSKIKNIYLRKKNYLLFKKKNLLKKYIYNIFWKNESFSKLKIKTNSLALKKKWTKFLIRNHLKNFFGFFTLTRPILLKSNRKKKYRLNNHKYAFKNFSSNINLKIKNKFFFMNNITINSFKKLHFFNSKYGIRSAYFQLSNFKTKGLNKFIINNMNYNSSISNEYNKNNFLLNTNLINLTTNFLFNNLNFNKNNFFNKEKIKKLKNINTNLIFKKNYNFNPTFDFKIFLNMRRKRSLTKKKTVNEVINWYYFWWYVDSGEDKWKIDDKKQSFRILPVAPSSLNNYSRYLSYKKFILPKIYSNLNKPLVIDYYKKLALKKKTWDQLYKRRDIVNLLNISRKYLYNSILKNRKFKSLSFFDNTKEFYLKVVTGTALKRLSYWKKKIKLEKKKTKAQKIKEKDLKKKSVYVNYILIKRRNFAEKLSIISKKLQFIIFKKPYDPYNIKEERRLALKKKNYPKLINRNDTDKNSLLIPPLRFRFKNFSPILNNSKILNYNKFIFQKNINKSPYLNHSKFYVKFNNSCKQVLNNFNSGVNSNIFKYKINRSFYFFKNKFIRAESIYFKNKVSSNILFDKKSFLFNAFFKKRIKKKRKFYYNSKNLLFNKYIPFRMQNFFHSKKKLIKLGLLKYSQYKRHYINDLDYRSFAILKELEIKRKMRLKDKLTRTKQLYSKRFLYWTHLKWFNIYINKNINNKTFKYYDIYNSFKSYEKFKKLNFYHLLSLGKKNSLNNKTRSHYNNVTYLNEFLKLKFKKINYYISYFKSKRTFLNNKTNLPIQFKLLKNWLHSIKFSANISKRIRYVTHLKYRPIRERLYLWRINKRKVKKLTKFYKEKKRLYISYLKEDSIKPEEKSQISFHLNLMKRRFLKFKHFHSSPMVALLKHVKKKIKNMEDFMSFWLNCKKKSKRWKLLRNKKSFHSNTWLWYKKKGFSVSNFEKFSKYYLVRKLFRSTRIKNIYEDPIILVKKFIEYLFFVLFKFSNLRLFYKKVYRINAMGQKTKLFKNLFNYRLATGFKVPFLVKIIYQKLSYDKQLIGCKIGFFGRYSKKLRNRKIWRYVRYLKPSNINTPLDYYNVVILQKWGITGFKLTMLRKKTVDLLFLNKF